MLLLLLLVEMLLLLLLLHMIHLLSMWDGSIDIVWHVRVHACSHVVRLSSLEHEDVLVRHALAHLCSCNHQLGVDYTLQTGHHALWLHVHVPVSLVDGRGQLVEAPHLFEGWGAAVGLEAGASKCRV